MWKNTYDAGDRYLQRYPRIKKWINQCVRCQAQGYKPEMPDSTDKPPAEGNAEFMNIRYRFKCLPVNADGLCDVCAEWEPHHDPTGQQL